MKNLIITFILALGFAFSIQASGEQYKYVWADSGLNLRQGPGTDQPIVEKIAFGDSIEILRVTDETYNITGIKQVDSTQYYFTRYERKAPFILYGHWVEVLTSTGNVGYVVSQYLLPIRPAINQDLRLLELSSDTISVVEQDYTQRFFVRHFDKGASASQYINDKGYEESFTFPDMSIQEVFVLLASSWGNFNNGTVGKNWKSELYFNDGELCEISILQKDGYVYATISCYC